MQIIEIKDSEFQVVQKLIFKETGISLGDNKKTMVQSRLEKRLKHHHLTSYSDYLKVVQISPAEKTEFVNELTTNETYFFRETKHFEFLEDLAKKSDRLRVWSAVASMGAEAYSIAMVLNEHLHKAQWEVVGSDINTKILNMAKIAMYPLSWSQKIPDNYRKKYCLQGSNKYYDKMILDRDFIQNVSFIENNLLKENEYLGQFDVIFLRNVLLYFTDTTKTQVIKNILKNLKQGGYLIISMTEHFNESEIENLKYLQNAIYQKEI